MITIKQGITCLLVAIPVGLFYKFLNQLGAISRPTALILAFITGISVGIYFGYKNLKGE